MLNITFWSHDSKTLGLTERRTNTNTNSISYGILLRGTSYRAISQTEYALYKSNNYRYSHDTWVPAVSQI